MKKELHLLRTKPGNTVINLTKPISQEGQITLINLYDEDLDWSKLVDDIFSHDKVICWW